MSGIYIDGISLGENHWAIISKFFRAVVEPTDTTVEGRFVEEHGKIWLILNEERHEVAPVPDHGRLIDADALKDMMIDALNDALPECRTDQYRKIMRDTTMAFMQDIDECPTIIPADKEEA